MIVVRLTRLATKNSFLHSTQTHKSVTKLSTKMAWPGLVRRPSKYPDMKYMNKKIWFNQGHTANKVPSIKATGVRFIRLVTSPIAHMLGTFVCENSSTWKRWHNLLVLSVFLTLEENVGRKRGDESPNTSYAHKTANKFKKVIFMSRTFLDKFERTGDSIPICTGFLHKNPQK